MKRLSLLVLIIVLLFAALSVRPAKADNGCYSTSIYGAEVVTLNAAGYPIDSRIGLRSPKLLSAILALQGRQTWVGYANGGFNPITNVYDMRIAVRFRDELGVPRINYLWVGYANGRPDYRQIYWFRSSARSTDTNGNYLGEHAFCGWSAIEVPKSVTDNLRALAGMR